MRTKIIALFILISATINLSTVAQEYKSFQIENIASEAVWPAVNKAFQELKLPRPMVNKNAGTGETSYYYYTALMIKNRARFRVEYKAGTLTISLFGRQYQSDKGWADNMMPMSKKQASNILDPLKDRIIELTKNNPFTAPGQIAQAKQESGKATVKDIEEKAGIYEDFVIVKTGNERMDLLAIHKDGNIVGYDLWEDKTTVKSLVFKKNRDSEAVTILFDEKGFPRGMVTDQCIVKISSDGGKMAELTVLDLQGKFIGNKKIELPIPGQEMLEIQDGKKSHGPSNPNILTFENQNYLSTSISTSSTTTKAVACGTSLIVGMIAEGGSAGTATPLVVAGVIAACESLYFELVARYVGKTHFTFEKLILASEISSYVADLLSLKDISKLKGIGLLTDVSDNQTIYNAIISGFCKLPSGAESLIDKYFTEREITIEGPTSIEAGYFGDKGTPIILYAKSNRSDVPIEWENSSDAIIIEKLGPYDTRNKQGYSAVRVWAVAPSIEKPIISATQNTKKDEDLDYIELEIISPNYFYFLDCAECEKNTPMDSELKAKIEECKKALENCKIQTQNNKDVLFIINSKNDIVEPKLNATKLNFLKKLSKKDGSLYPPDEYGEFKEFVKEAPCAYKCPGPDDEQTSSSQPGNDIFEETGCPKRTSRFFQFSQSKRNYYGPELQHLLDSLGANGWSVCKDANLLPIYLAVTHDTLSKPARNEKFSYKIFRNAARDIDFWPIIADSANIYGKQGYELIVLNMVSAIMMKDVTKPSQASLHYEYMLKTQIGDAFTSKRDFEMNGVAVTNILNQLGEQGWDLCVIGKNECVMQRVKEKANIKYEYTLVNMDGVSDVKTLFNSRGSEGWDYCLWPLVLHRSSFTPPIVMKRIKGQPKHFEYNFKFVSQINLFSSNSSFERALNDMRNAFRGTTSNGWKYSGVLTIDESFKEFHDKVFFVFQVDKGCK